MVPIVAGSNGKFSSLYVILILSNCFLCESRETPRDEGRDNRVTIHDLSCNWAFSGVSLFLRKTVWQYVIFCVTLL